MTNQRHFPPSGWAHILGEETNFRWGQTGLNLQSSENQFTLTVHDASSKLRFPLRPGILWSLRPVSETPLPPSDTVTQGSQRRKGKRTQSGPPREGLKQQRFATSKEWPPGPHELETRNAVVGLHRVRLQQSPRAFGPRSLLSADRWPLGAFTNQGTKPNKGTTQRNPTTTGGTIWVHACPPESPSP